MKRAIQEMLFWFFALLGLSAIYSHAQQIPVVHRNGVDMYSPDKPFEDIYLQHCSGPGCGAGGGGATIAHTTAVIKGDGNGNGVAAAPGTDFAPPVCLTTSGIQGAATYNSGTGCLNVPLYSGEPLLGNLGANVYADYNFSQGSGTTLSDVSGNGHDATFGGGAQAPTWVNGGVHFCAVDCGFTCQGILLPASTSTVRTFVIALYFAPVPQNNINYSTILVSDANGGGNAFFGPFFNVFMGKDNSFGYLSVANNTEGESANQQMTGFHVIAIVAGAGGGDLDRLYIDGVYVGGTINGDSATNLGNGRLWLGSSGVGPWGNQVADMTMYRARFYTSELSGADIASLTTVMRGDVLARGFPVAPLPSHLSTPQLQCLGDSITFGSGATTPFCSELSLTNQPSYTITNLGIAGIPIAEMTASEPNRAALNCLPVVGGPTVALVFAGTNDIANYGSGDPQNTFNLLSGEISALKSAGCRVGVATMLSRQTPGGYSGNVDANKDAYNALIRSQAIGVGADFIFDTAANPLLGADGAFSNATYFNSDLVHPTQAGQDILAAETSNALNYFFGSSAGNPTVKTATTPYTMAAGDRFLEFRPSANQVTTLPDCLGQTGAVYHITMSNAGSFTLTVKNAVSGEPINGVDQSSTGLVALTGSGTVTFTDVANSSVAAGCYWSH